MKNWIFIYSILILCHLPLSLLTGIDEGHRLLYIMDVAVFVYLLSSHKLFKNLVREKISLLWLGLMAYHTVNSFFHQVPYDGGYVMMFLTMFNTYLMMMLSAYCCLLDRNKFLMYLMIGFTLFLAITLKVTSMGEMKRLEGSINATQIGQTAGCAMFVAILSYFSMGWKTSKLVLFSILPFWLALMAGSRNGLLLFFFALATLLLAKSLINFQLKNLIWILVGFVIFYFAADYILNNTVVGERMLTTSDQAEDFGLETGTFLDVFGDRGVYYFFGWQLFKRSPVFGIGLWNFRYLSPLTFNAPLHSEYMVHLCEGGLVGAYIYLSYLQCFARDVIGCFKRSKQIIPFILLIIFIAYLAVGLSARLFCATHFSALFGLMLAEVVMEKQPKCIYR